MTEKCKNCDQIISGNYCAYCGQKKFNRIDKKYVFDEMQYTFLHANKGLLYSVKKIIKNPGKTAREYIEGNRVNHYKPILLDFVLSGIATFISYKVLGLNEMIKVYNADKHVDSQFMDDLMSGLSSYSSVLMILSIPLLALTTKISFRKWGHNYYEHIVLIAYIISYYTIISILIIYPLMFAFRYESVSLYFAISQFSIVLVPPILLWFFKEFYKEKSLKDILLKCLLVVTLTIVGFLLLLILITIGIAVYIVLNGPDSINYMQPK